ncbi:hypothetical protein [Streptomyces montanisoli]|uniref:Uncharacterized protein n=1 Tax=Streptomyces montanisoli TaxID=2798581 RepID=A0A940MAQ7_9ACTN|nr:hypothetical protein [Streptomyces montanisoli]MBP0457502.1 hypothetical protein [Streptomyces montanisoli]
MPEDERFVDELGLAMHRTGDVFTPADSGALVEGGVARGRRRQARRRIAAVAGSVLAAGAAAFGGAYGAGIVGAGGTPAAASRAADPSLASATPAAFTGPQMVAAMRKVMPAGSITGVEATGVDERPGPTVSFVYDDHKGPSAVSLAVEGASAAARDRVTCPDKGAVPYDDCTTSTLPDGSRLMIMKGYEYPDRREKTKLWTGTLVAPGGGTVEAREWNAPSEKGSQISRAEPPLDTEQLEKLVSSDVWHAPLAQMSARHPRTPVPPSATQAPDGDTLRKTLRALLPPGIKVTGQGTGDDGEYTYLLVDDGRGVTRLEINVQPNMSDVRDQLFGSDSTTLPDGTQLSRRKEPSEKGGAGMVMWQADTMRPDGLRVVVFESNGAQQYGPKTRTTPALTLDQLTKIATSKQWLKWGRAS